MNFLEFKEAIDNCKSSAELDSFLDGIVRQNIRMLCKIRRIINESNSLLDDWDIRRNEYI